VKFPEEFGVRVAGKGHATLVFLRKEGVYVLAIHNRHEGI